MYSLSLVILVSLTVITITNLSFAEKYVKWNEVMQPMVAANSVQDYAKKTIRISRSKKKYTLKFLDKNGEDWMQCESNLFKIKDWKKEDNFIGALIYESDCNKKHTIAKMQEILGQKKDIRLYKFGTKWPISFRKNAWENLEYTSIIGKASEAIYIQFKFLSTKSTCDWIS